MEGKETKKYQVRVAPLNLFFLRCKDRKGNEWFDIFLNGAGYPSIEDTEKCLNSLKRFLKEAKKKGQRELDRINKEIEEEQMKEMTECRGIDKKKIKERGYIYLLKSNGLYKIGRAKNPKDRLVIYRTENPFGIKVILQKEVDDYIQAEKNLLDKFKGKKVKGEWFKLSQKDIQWIKSNI